MNQKQMRRMAQGAARSEMNRLGMDPVYKKADAALRVLDDLDRMEPDLIASIWYAGASSNQIRLFKREWAIGNRRTHRARMASVSAGFRLSAMDRKS